MHGTNLWLHWYECTNICIYFYSKVCSDYYEIIPMKSQEYTEYIWILGNTSK